MSEEEECNQFLDSIKHLSEDERSMLIELRYGSPLWRSWTQDNE